MMERLRRDRDPDATRAGATGATSATDPVDETDRTDRTDRIERAEATERTAAHDPERTTVHEPVHDPAVTDRDQRFRREGTITSSTMAAARRRQREEFGGINWGAAFFGFLSAAGLAAILIAIVSAAGATLTFGSDASASEAAETIGIAGGIAMLVVLVLSYFAGGYVAGRMSRFDGGRQGLGVWLVALVVTVILAAAGAILGGEYNVLEQLNLPRIPVDEGTIATGAIIALAVAIIGSLVAAMAGGKAGERYHRKVDRLAVDDGV